MCGIAAGLGRAAGDIDRLLDGVAHRGPDARGSFVLGSAAVGAVRLRVVGGAAGDQPLVEAGLAAAWNGEAYNDADLGSRRPDQSDLSAVAAAFRREGPQAFGRVRGPFAAAFLELGAPTGRSTAVLHLARDPFGVRPLFVSEGRFGLRAASEPWPLIEALGPDAVLDPSAVGHLLAFQFQPTDRGLVRGVDPVPAGVSLQFESEGDGRIRAGRPTSVSYTGPIESDLGPELRRAAALQGPCRLRTGVFLSGGLDSSAVAGLLNASGARPNVAFVGWFPEAGPALDERPHARAVARELGIPLREVAITAADALAFLPRAALALGGPSAGPGSLSAFVLARAAADDGVGVVFTGQGGDELFGGYERHRILSALETGRSTVGDPAYSRLAAAMSSAADPLRAAVVRGDALRSLLEPDARRALDEAAARLPEAGPGRVDRAMAFERREFLPGLFAVDDRALGAFGIEGRPLLADPAIVAVAASVPYAVKSPHAEPRRWFRTALGDALPGAALRRTDKMGFPMPLDAWSAGPWREPASDLFGGDALVEFGFRRGAVKAAFERGVLGAREVFFCMMAATFERMLAEVRTGVSDRRSIGGPASVSRSAVRSAGAVQ